MATFVVSYVDDLRTGSHGSQTDGDHLVHHVAAMLNYLGQQDASRKRGFASCTPGAWAGAVVEAAFNKGIYVTVTQAKWDKVKGILSKYSDILRGSANPSEIILLDRKSLEQDVGFLVHVTMTYTNLRPFLKGFYLSLNSWRHDRDEDGWKSERTEWEETVGAFDEEDDTWESGQLGDVNLQAGWAGAIGPPTVRMVDRMRRDVEVLMCMFDRQTPSRRLVRGRDIARVLYGFGDASGAGFGASWTEPMWKSDSSKGEKPSIRYRFGRWGSDAEDASSNYRELKNLVDVLAEMGEKGELSGVEVFLFTDNSTAEASFAHGSSKSSVRLFDLVKRLKVLEMTMQTRLHIIHVSGQRMIVQGTDGLSRGVLSEGVMGGNDMNSFVPLHLAATQRSEGLLKWLKECCDPPGRQGFELLSVDDWFEKGHDVIGGDRNEDGVWIPKTATGFYVWAPPPPV